MNVKAGLGNNGAGSGAIDFIAAVLALHYGTVPAAFNSKPLDAALELNVVAEGPRDANVGHVAATSYALGGGQNAALVLRRYRD